MPVYLLHFNEGLPHGTQADTQHYMGFTDNLERRIDEHRKGQGNAKLTTVAHARGIGFTVARVWIDGDKKLERKLKVNGRKRYCPICAKLGLIPKSQFRKIILKGEAASANPANVENRGPHDLVTDAASLQT